MVIRHVIPSFLLFVGGVIAACGDASNSASSTADAGGDGAASVPLDAGVDSERSSTICGRFFDAFAACGAISPYPSAEIERIRARYEQACASQLSLPGKSIATEQLEACLQEYRSFHCDGSRMRSIVCRAARGTFPNGAACNDGDQCRSTRCALERPDGGEASACGTCTNTIEEGQPCGDGGSCVSGTKCDSLSSTPSCKAIAYGEVGAACGTSAAPSPCKDGLVCFSTSICQEPGGSGAECTYRAECKADLTCLQDRCAAPAQADERCSANNDCAKGLACDLDAMKCVQRSWARAGETCGGSIECIVGSCQTIGDSPPSCPRVIPDGQPCTSGNRAETCDSFANCVGGTCVLVTSACR